MKVEIFSDVACPFCYIGMMNFRKALAAYPDPDSVDVTWRSFQLNPEMPRDIEGDMYDYLSEKFGVTRDEARTMNDRVLASAHGAGIDMDFDQARPANTFDAHRMLHLAAEQGVGEELGLILFDTYFNGRADVADPEVLIALAARAGVDRAAAEEVAAGDRFAEEVKADRALASELGISAVPTFVIDRRLGVSGAQPPEILLGALTQAAEESAAPPAG
jgi:predicted DsbA family dithiol-disulfide isomerase